KESEDTRNTQESTREVNESTRQSNEEERKINEEIRQESISNMQKNIDDKVVEVNNKIIEVNTAKTDMTTTVSNKITEIENRFNELETIDVRGEIVQARETTDNQIKSTLKERLNYDFDKLISVMKSLINDGLESLESTYSSTEIKKILKNGLDKKSDLEHVHDIYVEKVEGKGLSTEDYTTEEKEKLSELETFKNKETKFNANGSITEILDNNIKYITKFNTSGSISKEKYVNDILISTTITRFKNGMIEESVIDGEVI
ncbi:hypothetical protein KW95_01815, partial [Clostridioides difficile]